MLRNAIISILLILTGTVATQAQHFCSASTHENDGAIFLKTINGVEIPHDADGNIIEAHPIFNLSISEREERGLLTSVSANGNTIGRGNEFGPTFHLTYLDQVNNTNEGFDDSALGEERRAALEAAFAYFSSIMDDVGEADIEIRESFFANPNSNPFGLAAAYYFGSKGFNSPFTQSHIVSGNDPYGPYPDGYLQFNFHSMLNYNYNYSADPNNQQFDFYTIALHEIMHLLGFTSYASETGVSIASDAVYTTFDKHLVDENLNILFAPSGSGSSTAFASLPNGILTNSQVWFELYTDEYAPVYSPNPFSGSSLGHFDNNRSSHGEYVMHPSLSKGDGFKLLHEDEVRVLEKLGYEMDYSVATAIDEEPELAETNNGHSTLYPNPAHSSDGIQIDLGEVNGSEILINVYDMMGRKSYSKVIQNQGTGTVTAIDSYSNLSPGMYIVIGSAEQELFSEKLMIK